MTSEEIILNNSNLFKMFSIKFPAIKEFIIAFMSSTNTQVLIIII